jgi:hypothetical protein
MKQKTERFRRSYLQTNCSLETSGLPEQASVENKLSVVVGGRGADAAARVSQIRADILRRRGCDQRFCASASFRSREYVRGTDQERC